MDKRHIESRYSIEYVYPENAAPKKKSKPFIIGLSTISLLAAGVLASNYPFESFNTADFNSDSPDITTNPDTTSDNGTELATEDNELIKADTTELSEKLTPTEMEDVVIVNTNSKPVSTAPKQQTKVDNEKQDNENNQLTQSLNQLTQQLMAEKQKNEALKNQLNQHLSEKEQLNKLLQVAISKANANDKKYLAALDNLDTLKAKPVPIKAVNQQKLVYKPKIDNKIATTISAKEVSREDQIDETNAISLETHSQIDAIMAAVKGTGKLPTPAKQPLKQPTINKTTMAKVIVKNDKPKVQPNKTELLYIQLQRQINQLINAKTLPLSQYKQALTKESEERKNAVRSIVVKKGETLWAIAKRAYGNGSLYKKIIKANPQITKNGKLHLKVGQVIRVPI